MYREEIAAISNGAEAKVRLLKENPGGYIIMSLLGGIYIGFGVLISFTLGGQLQGEPYAKLVMAIFFSVALSLIIIAGAELFTGNNMVLAVGYMKHKVTIADVLKIFVICWLGNVIGSALLAGLFNLTGLYIDGTQAAVVGAAAVKRTFRLLRFLREVRFANSSCALRCGAALDARPMQASSSWYSGASLRSLPRGLSTALLI